MKAKLIEPPNGWVVTDDAGGQHTVFCAESANTEADAIAILADSNEPREASIHDVRETALRDFVRWIEGVGESVIGLIPAVERASWPAKEAAARNIAAGGEPLEQDMLLLGPEIAFVGGTTTDLAASILGMADRFRRAAGILTGARRSARDRIAAARTATEVFEAVSDVTKQVETELMK